jgi:hypothetical protein
MVELTHMLRWLNGKCLGRVHCFLGVRQGHGFMLQEAFDDGQTPSRDLFMISFFSHPPFFLKKKSQWMSLVLDGKC